MFTPHSAVTFWVQLHSKIFQNTYVKYSLSLLVICRSVNLTSQISAPLDFLSYQIPLILDLEHSVALVELLIEKKTKAFLCLVFMGENQSSTSSFSASFKNEELLRSTLRGDASPLACVWNYKILYKANEQFLPPPLYSSSTHWDQMNESVWASLPNRRFLEGWLWS